jgi:hypothetical protein
VKPTAPAREVGVNDRLHAKITGPSRQAHDGREQAEVMTRSLLLLAVLGTGCVILPTTKTTTRNAGTEQSALAYGKITATTLQTASSRTDVRVRATNYRECQRQIFAVTEIKKSKHAKLGVDDPRGRALGIIFAPVTLPISAIITGIVVASADDETKRMQKPLRTETSACTTDAAGLSLDVQFPSGAIQRGRTDSHGVLVAAIPSDEPYAGNVIVRGAQVTAEVHYEQAVPPISAARNAVEACRAEYQVGGVTLKLTIDARGLAARTWMSAGDDRVTACVRARIAGVVFPRSLRDATLVLSFEAPTT